MPKIAAALANARIKVFAHSVRHEKLGILRPAIAALGQTDLFDSERLAMGGAGIVLMRSAIADMAIDDDQRGYVVRPAECLDRLRDPLRVIGVADPLHVPAIGKEARRDVVAEGEIGVAFDRYAVAVVDPTQVPEHQVARERGGFAGDALHHVAIAAYRINVVIEYSKVRAIEVLRQPALSNGHADARRAALSERPGCRLDARGHMIFRVPRAFAADLAETLDVVERDRRLAGTLVFGVNRLDAGEMQHRIEQHRGVPIGQHETIAVRPDRIVRIKPQEMLPQRINHRRQGHRRTGVAGIGLLHGIHRQSTDRVDAELINRTIARRCQMTAFP